MASSLSRTIYRSLFSTSRTKSYTTTNFNLSSLSYCTNSSRNVSDSPLDSVPDSVSEVEGSKRPASVEYALETGLDYGIYKAILVGQVGQTPFQKKLRNGTTVTMLSIGTGGLRNNWKQLENEDPKDYANRGSVQWHRVTIYGEKLGDVAIKHVTPGSILYLEGNLEMKIFSDPISGIVRRVREVAIRKHGRLVYLGQGSNSQMSNDLKRVGYF
ncbi:Single-stranded DNA-binding protein, mitochondrial [Heracleum sosnowskyi]|uniref:Single-stranded DNA-binding protein, mitochondrial n=1 Tax=Heracleum sosnowskyi TaxID=360622 RepID=A0AAD8MGL9_9APIA|nr:Single-stranded DNA-binding protein, mitochondrial [Heracleum sosnowskyi]